MSRARLILTVTGLLLLCAPAVIAAAALSGIGHRWVDILAQFVASAMLGTVLVGAMAVILRLWVATAMSAAIGALLLVAGAPQWFPPKGTAAPDAAAFSLYSANVWIGNRDVAALARSVAAADADVVVLIEVGEPMVGGLDRVLGAYPHRWTGPIRPGGRASRQAFASRYPLRPVAGVATQMDSRGAVVETPAGPVTVVGVHLTRPWPYRIQWEQIRQAQGVAGWRAAYPGPLIVAGDFNSVSSARVGRQIQAETGLIPAPGWPGTWPTALPSAAAMTIDQVYRSPDLALVERRLGQRNGSDHRPVITRFARAAPPPAG
ncbi:endonuclease [Brevundimonas sp. LM2]|uniref:endonuclease/exonuclease/phosphatase family protein n=1 Tax=Brevundimonas sp. LM2 TaxID=1938605 RepID=UPI000983AF14|nr:endonuclease/exonuclease/phosphatase family protein [Brevundimonas sp. LM2]AQR61369.1 endonuclease [Brevundimonas sp. LM2]